MRAPTQEWIDARMDKIHGLKGALRDLATARERVADEQKRLGSDHLAGALDSMSDAEVGIEREIEALSEGIPQKEFD